MYKHEQKHCPCCGKIFECKPGSIMQCQCSAIKLSVEERVYIETKYEDCLCIDCMKQLQKEYLVYKEKHFY